MIKSIFLIFIFAIIPQVFAEENITDLAIINLSLIQQNNTYEVIVIISNLGNQNILNTTIYFLLNGQEFLLEIIPETQPNQTLNLTAQLNLTNGVHIIAANLDLADDNNSNNDISLQINVTDNLTEQLPDKDLQIELFLNNPVYTSTEYTKLFKITNLDHISGQTDSILITIYYNITKNNSLVKEDLFSLTINSYTTSNTGLAIFNSTGTYGICGNIITSSYPDNNSGNNIACQEFIIEDTNNISCDVSINISVDKTLYNNQETIEFYNILTNESFSFIIEYWIEDLFENIVKSKTNTSNTNQKSYTPNIDETDRILVIKNKLMGISCNNSGEEESEIQVIVIKEENLEDDSSISIKDTSPSSIEFGSIVRVEIDTYKGDTNKKVIEAWVEGADGKKISSANSKITLNKKYSQYSFTLPLQLKPNCNNDFNDGSYILFVEGLSVSDQYLIDIEGKTPSLCGVEYIENPNSNYLCNDETNNEQKSTRGFYYSIFSVPSTIENNKSFIATINLTNKDDYSHNISIWSYVYKGAISYSGNRTANLNILVLPPATTILLNLTNKVLNADSREYKLKIRINKDNQQTNKEITRNIRVIEAQEMTESVDASQKQTIRDQDKGILPTGMVSLDTKQESVFQSSTIRIKNHLHYIILAIFILTILLLIKIKNKK